MTKRKTVSVLSMIVKANRALEAADQPSLTKEQNVGYRLGLCSMLHTMLHEAGVYAGYAYHTTYVAGVTDESRRSYLIHDSLLVEARQY